MKRNILFIILCSSLAFGGISQQATVSTTGNLKVDQGSAGSAWPVSLSGTLTTIPAASSTWPVSGTFWQSLQPVVTTPSVSSITTVPAGGSTWPVSGTFFQTTQPISISAGGSNVNLNAINGVAIPTGTGVGGLGIQRVTVSSDSSLAANQSVNMAQIAGVTTSVNNGLSGTGVQRVNIASDNTAFSVNAIATAGTITTYSASSTGILSATLATDIFYIAGSSSKTIRITRLGISATQTTAGEIEAILLIRSVVDAGSSTSVTRVAHDSSDAAASATVSSFTANPTTGSLVGNIRVLKLFAPAAATAALPSFQEIKFGDGIEKPIVLRGTQQILAVNLNGATVTGGSFDIYVEWQEQ